MSIEKGTQSLAIKNSNISGSQVAIGNNIKQAKITNICGPGKTLTSTEVLTIIQEMQSLVQNSKLQDDKKSKCLRHLQTVKEEVKEENPDKEYAAQTLQKMIQLLNETRKASNPGDCVLDKLQPVITRMVPWLGETKKFLVI